MLAWSLWGFVPVAGWALAWSLAYWVYTTAPHRTANRRLAFVLLIDGIFGAFVGGFVYILTDPVASYASRQAAMVAGALVPFAYVRFLATLDSPFRGFLASPTTRGAVLLAGIAVAAAVILGWQFYVDIFPSPYGTWEPTWGGWAAAAVFGGFALTNLLGLVVAATAWARAEPHTTSRRHARLVAYAFGIRDLGMAVVLVTWAVGEFVDRQRWADSWDIPVSNSAPVVAMVLLAYALLRHQVFGIELRFKEGVRRSLIGLPFAAAFFVLAETLEGALPFPGYLAGLAGAGVVALALQPIQRGARAAADRLFPGVEDSAEYRGNRAQALYEAALESATADGIVTARERALLLRLRTELGIAPEAARALERRLSVSWDE